MKKYLISSIVCIAVSVLSCISVFAQDITYKVQQGDTYYSIGVRYKIPLDDIINANNAVNNTTIYPGNEIVLPFKQFVYVTKQGDSFWSISKLYEVNFSTLLSYNNANSSSELSIGQIVKIPPKPEIPTIPQPVVEQKPYITYTSYIVNLSDNVWNIALKFGLPMSEVLNVNNLNENSILYKGMVLKIPVHHIPIKSTPNAKNGESLDWWSEAQYVIPIQTDFEVLDYYSGKSFFARRTIGANHADCESLTLADTNKMKEIWGGIFSWIKRPVIVKVNGRSLAASCTSMPHAGNDAVAGGVWTSWRSDNYGPGINFDYIKNNGANGHFDIHFLNSTTHKDGSIDLEHQKCIKIAAGIN